MPSFLNSVTHHDLVELKGQVEYDIKHLECHIDAIEHRLDLLLKHLELEVDTKPRLRKIEDLLDKEQCSEKV